MQILSKLFIKQKDYFFKNYSMIYMISMDLYYQHHVLTDIILYGLESTCYN